MSSMTSGLTPRGIWLPLITPFYNGELDTHSLRNLITHYQGTGITGYVLAGTTGESMALDIDETRRLVSVSQEANTARLPVILGLGGSNTQKLVNLMKITNSWDINGYLVTAPYYVRPTQEGLYCHYHALAEGSHHPVTLYNIPYRTSVNMANDTVFRLAEHQNIVAIKDCCAIREQSLELITRKPAGFSVLVGDDNNFFDYAKAGADGGILASSHIGASLYTTLSGHLRSGKITEATRLWETFSPKIPLLFREPNPAPIKYLLAERGIIRSPEVRLPLMEPTSKLQQDLKSAFSMELT